MTVESSNRASGAAVAFTLAVVFFVIIAIAVKLVVKAPAVDADHGDLITKAMVDLRVSEDKTLNTAGWIDQQRGIVRIPIDTAIQQAATEEAGQIRDDLKKRAEKAAAPAPVAPAKPSIFE
jgi:hypothetical protein